MTGRHAIVVGAGIGGLAAAAGLARIGWRVTVLERASRLREAGAAISLLTNAQRALDRLGVAEAALTSAARMRPGGEGLRTPSGRRLQRAADPAFLAAHGLSLAILPRRRLHGALADAVSPDRVCTDAEAVAVSDGDSFAEVTYRDATGARRTVRGDVVVGADGTYSAIRALRWPHARLVYSGHSVFRGIALGVDGAGEPGGSTWGRGLEFGRMPLGPDRVYWFGVANTPHGTRFPDSHGEVLRRFGSWHDPIPALLAATPAETVLHHDILELADPLSSFVSGRVALLGDAAHAMTSDLGQGACQALEDAVVLCACLAGAGDVPSALAGYDAQRLPRAQGIAVASRRMGEFKLTERRLELVRRNAKLRLSRPRSGERGLAAVGDWHPPELEPALLPAPSVEGANP